MEVATGQGAITLEHEGRQVFFCCTGCRDAFAANPAEHAAG
jgi:YHS domain-containing protein